MPKTIIINESLANELNDALKMTQFKFKSNIRKFLAGLLEDPTGTEPDAIFTVNGLDKNKLIKSLTDNNVIKKKMTIDDHDSEGNPHTAKMIVRYSVPKERFNERLDALYDILFPDVDAKINEDGGGAASCSGVDGNGFGSGEFIQPIGGVQRHPADPKRNYKKKNTVGGDAYSVEIINEAVTGEDSDKSAALYVYNEDKDHNWYILCARRSNRKDDEEGGKWNPPMGHLHKGETLKDGAIRECLEESGIDFSKYKKELVKKDSHTWGSNFVLQLGMYVDPEVTIDDFKPGKGDEENSQFVWLPLTEIQNKTWAWSCGENAIKFIPGEIDLSDEMEYMTESVNEYSDSVINTDDFSTLPSFAKQVAYCRKTLGRPIGVGSSRIVFRVDDNKVLKLAKNKKGIAQNEAECENCNDYYAGDMFAQVFEYDKERYTYIVCEEARPPKESDFKRIMGVTYEQFCRFCFAFESEYSRYSRPVKLTQEDYDFLEDNEELSNWWNYISNYQPTSVAEIIRKCNLGVAHRPYGDTIIITDSGFNDDVKKLYGFKESVERGMLAESKKYVNMDVDLRKGGRKAVKMSIDDFQNEFNNLYWEYMMKNEKDAFYIRHLNAGPGIFHELAYGNKKHEKDSMLSQLYKDIWCGKYKFDTENVENRGGIKMSKKGFPYVEMYAGGDWECPVCFFIYFDGSKFRGYVPLKGNAICRYNNSAFTGDNEEDSDEVKFLKKEFGVNSYGELPVNTNDVDYNVDACLEDFLSRVEVSGTYKHRDYSKTEEKFKEYQKKKKEEEKQEKIERERKKAEYLEQQQEQQEDGGVDTGIGKKVELNEYFDKYYGNGLRKHVEKIRTDDSEDIIDSGYIFMEDFINENDDVLEKYNELVNSGQIDNKEYFDYDDVLKLFDGPLSEYRQRFVEYCRKKFNTNGDVYPTGYPMSLVMDYTKEVHNEWLVHFTDNSADIYRYGFMLGTDSYENLAYSGCGTGNKYGPGYDFAFRADDVDSAFRGRFYSSSNPKYGHDCILFRASGIQMTHYGDEEEQVIFYGPSAKDLIFIYNSDVYGDWHVDSEITGNTIYRNEELQNVVFWCIQNFQQYRQHLLGRVNQQKRFKYNRAKNSKFYGEDYANLFENLDNVANKTLNEGNQHLLNDFEDEICGSVVSLLNEFKYTGKIDWSPIIKNPQQYNFALQKYMELGDNFMFPEEKVDEWLKGTINRILKLLASTELLGHSEYFPFEDVDEVYGEEFVEWCNDKGCESEQDYDVYSEFLEDIGLYDACTLPDGSLACSDYGFNGYFKVLDEYRTDMSAGEKLVMLNRLIDVWHCRGNLSCTIIEGGSSVLTRISNGQMNEVLNRVINESVSRTICQFLGEGRKKVTKNDKGEVVPDVCDKCGSKVGLYIHGEPVYLCSKCGKYFGTMPFPKNLKESLDEYGKQDNLHQFVQHIVNSGKPGRLKTNMRNFENIKNGYINCNFNFFDEEDSTWLKETYFERVLKNKFPQYADAEFSDIDEYDEIFDDKDFYDWCKEWLIDDILYSIDFSDDGLIKIERNIEIPEFSATTNDANYYDEQYGQSLGRCWTYLEGAGHSYGAEGSVGPEIILYGLCRPEDVDWGETISTFVANGCEEYELCFDGDVELYAIATNKGKHAIWRGNLIFTND